MSGRHIRQNRPARTVPIFRNDDLGLPDEVLIRIFLVTLLPVDKHDHVGILGELAGFPDVAVVGLALEFFDILRELRQDKKRHLKLHRHALERPADFRQFVRAAAVTLVGLHELDVIYHRQRDSVMLA